MKTEIVQYQPRIRRVRERNILKLKASLNRPWSGSAPGFEKILGWMDKNSSKSLMNIAWSAIMEKVEKNAWIFVLAPAIAPTNRVIVPRVSVPVTVR